MTLDGELGRKKVEVEERRSADPFARSSSTPHCRTQPALVALLRERANADLVLDVELIGVRPDELDLHVEEVEAELAEQFLKVRVRDRSVAPLPEGPVASADTVLGAFIRDLEARVAEVEAVDARSQRDARCAATRTAAAGGAEVTLEITRPSSGTSAASP